jgi:(5-formylfuran-3-yl)methyl phosphate synthase
MQVLISPVSLEEAASIIEAKADIIDIKNVNEGSLGAQFPWNIAEIVEFIHGHGVTASATLGDLPYKPGTAALAAYGVAHCGVNYIKGGLHGLNTYAQAVEMMEAIRRAVRMVSADAKVVASGYADYRRFNGLNTWDLVRAAKAAQCDVVMVDTAIKDGKTLFDVLSREEITDFVGMAKEANLLVALAGSIKAEHAEELLAIQPDIIGVRGAVCGGTDRYSKISVEKTKAFLKLFRQEAPEATAAEQIPV